ncbi:unnamed protein product [Musa hybrid cultivar]
MTARFFGFLLQRCTPRSSFSNLLRKLNWRKNEVEGYNGVYESHSFQRDSSRCWLQFKLDVESDLLFCILLSKREGGEWIRGKVVKAEEEVRNRLGIVMTRTSPIVTLMWQHWL